MPRLLPAFLLFLSGLLPGDTPVSGVLNPDRFEALHRLMEPSPAELKWEAIQWRTDLWESRREAAKTGKPIYLWEMDGHPLGCT